MRMLLLYINIFTERSVFGKRFFKHDDDYGQKTISYSYPKADLRSLSTMGFYLTEQRVAQD